MKKLKVTPLVKKHLKGLRTELVASMCLFVKSGEIKGYNLGLRKAVDFVDSYLQGSALMQNISKKDLNRKQSLKT